MSSSFFLSYSHDTNDLLSFPTRRSSDLVYQYALAWQVTAFMGLQSLLYYAALSWLPTIFQDRGASARSEEHTSELQSRVDLVCRLPLEKKNRKYQPLGADRVRGTSAGAR